MCWIARAMRTSSAKRWGPCGSATWPLVVVHANHGVGVGTDAVWKCATENGIPKFIVVNAFDKEETDFEKSLAHIREHFGDRVFPLTLPVNAGPGFNQVLDVLRNEVTTYAADKSGKFTEAPATGALAERVKQLHNQLIEYIAESDDALMEKFFAQGGLSEEEMRASLHAAIQKQVFVPLFCTAAESNIGVARLMDVIAKYGSSPVDRPKVEAADGDGNQVEVKLTDPDPVLYVFKTMSEAQFGELSFFRVYSGSVKFGSELYNTARRSTREDRPDLPAQRQDPHERADPERGGYRRGGQAQGHPHGQHALRRQETCDAAESRVSQAEHPRFPEEQRQRRGRQGGLGAGRAAPRRPDVPLHGGFRAAPDHCFRPRRTAFGGDRRRDGPGSERVGPLGNVQQAQQTWANRIAADIGKLHGGRGRQGRRSSGARRGASGACRDPLDTTGYGALSLKLRNPWPAVAATGACCLIGGLGLMRAYRMTIRFYQGAEGRTPRRTAPKVNRAGAAHCWSSDICLGCRRIRPRWRWQPSAPCCGRPS